MEKDKGTEAYEITMGIGAGLLQLALTVIGFVVSVAIGLAMLAAIIAGVVWLFN